MSISVRFAVSAQLTRSIADRLQIGFRAQCDRRLQRGFSGFQIKSDLTVSQLLLVRYIVDSVVIWIVRRILGRGQAWKMEQISDSVFVLART